MKTIIFTSSWDDGHPLDKKLLQLLLKYNIRGTFYISLQNKERRVMGQSDIKEISDMNMEIGSHSFTHPDLTKLNNNELLYEIKRNKNKLEKIIEKPVVSFCYPKGKFNKNMGIILKKSGFCLSRTTLLFHTTSRFNPLFMPTTVNFSNRSYLSYFKQGVRELNFKGFYNWLKYFKLEKNPLTLSLRFLDALSHSGGYFHLWGHSWEIEQQKLWNDLEKLMFKIRKLKNVIYLTNHEVIEYSTLQSSFY